MMASLEEDVHICGTRVKADCATELLDGAVVVPQGFGTDCGGALILGKDVMDSDFVDAVATRTATGE